MDSFGAVSGAHNDLGVLLSGIEVFDKEELNCAY
jgi:hypothetical protein